LIPAKLLHEYTTGEITMMTYSATVRIEDPDGALLYITKTSQLVIDQGEILEPIRILVEPV